MACFTPQQYKMVTKGLSVAFPGFVPLANMLRAVAGTSKVQRYPNAPIVQKLQNLHLITSPGVGTQQNIYDILQEIEASDLCRELVKTAHEWNPFEPNLEALNRQFMHIKTVEPDQEEELERLITEEAFLNPVRFAERFGPIRYRVCRIEQGPRDNGHRQPQATGFLINPDVVLTNHHVIAPVLKGKQEPRTFVFGFDRVDAEDGTQTAGPTYGLYKPDQQDQWLLAMSETGELDYALLRLDEPAGDQPIVRGTRDPDAANRGRLSLSVSGSQSLKKGSPLIIFQHPYGMPLRMDLRWVDARSDRRVTYTTNTMKGSSGSPCFDRELRLCALHRAGPDYGYNQGVPVEAIVADLEHKGLVDKVAVE